MQTASTVIYRLIEFIHRSLDTSLPTVHEPPPLIHRLTSTIPYLTFFAPTNAAFDHVPFYDSIDAHYDFTQTLKNTTCSRASSPSQS